MCGHILGVGTAIDADPGGKRGGTAKCGLRTAVPPILSITPPEGAWSPGERQQPMRIPIWRNCQNWCQRSPAFSGDQLRIQREENERVPSSKPK